MLYYEKKFKAKGFDIIIGVDEVGRGPLAGPIVAAAFSLREEKFKARIDDSKKLTARQRERAFLEITSRSLFGLSVINEGVIDRLNIQQANRLAMHAAVDDLVFKLKRSAQAGLREEGIYILVDGNIKLDLKYPYKNIINGDGKSKSIACASIIAKVIRDRIMYLYDKVYPAYGFIRHKGYPTPWHKNRLKKLGPTPIHRKSFSYA